MRVVADILKTLASRLLLYAREKNVAKSRAGFIVSPSLKIAKTASQASLSIAHDAGIE